MNFDNWDVSPEGDAKKPVTRTSKISLALIIGGAIITILPLGTVAYGAVSQWTLQNQWTDEFDKAAHGQEKKAKKGYKSSIEDDVLSERPLFTRASNRTRFPATKIKIPKIGVDQVVIEGTGPEELKKGPGHYRGMSVPGEPGNVGIAGHRVTWTKPFNRLDELDNGDVIVLETFEKRFEYRVMRSQVLDPTDTTMLRPTSDPRVTLTTCNPKFSARTRLDVQAVLVRTIDKTPKVVRVIDDIKKGFQAALGKSDDEPKIPAFTAKSELELAQSRVRSNPKDARARMHLGVLYVDSHRPASAAIEFKKAIRIEPGDALAHYYYAMALLAEDKKPEAVGELKRATSLQPTMEPALFQLGKHFLSDGDPKTAARYLSEAVKLSPLEAENHYYLALAHEQTGALKEAAQHYRKVLEFVPEDVRAKEGLERVSE